MTGLSAHRGCCGVHASYGRQANVDYSYFDDGLRENAGVAVTPDGTPCIYSGKVRGFSGDAIAAAYTLQGAYLDGPFVVVCNESPWVDEEMDDIADWVQHIVRTTSFRRRSICGTCTRLRSDR